MACKQNEGRRGKTQRRNAKRGITGKALERERDGEMGGGMSLYFSAPFGSFIPHWLGFIGGSFNNKSSTFEIKLGSVCVGRAFFHIILEW